MRRIKFEQRSCGVPPVIRLKGQWLVEAGFTPGQHVEVVSVAPGQLVIRVPEPCAAEQARQSLLSRFASLGL